MENFKDRIGEVKEDLRDLAFNFLLYQPLTATIIKPYNDFLNGPLQEIVAQVKRFDTDSTIGIVEFSNVTLVPPFKGALGVMDVDKELMDLRHDKALQIAALEKSHADLDSVKFRMAVKQVQRNYLTKEHELMVKNYGSTPRDNWLLPSDAEDSDKTYMLSVYADVTIREAPKRSDMFNLSPEESALYTNTHLSGEEQKRYMNKYTQKSRETKTVQKMIRLFSIPLMVGSSMCWLTISGATPEEYSQFRECDIAPKGYFIINGNPKVFVTQIKLSSNEARCLVKKTPDKKESVIMELKSKSVARPSNAFTLEYLSPPKKTGVKETKILNLTLPFMTPGIGTSKVFGSEKGQKFNALYVFRFYVIWYLYNRGELKKFTGRQTMNMALGQFNLYLRDACFRVEDEVGSEKEGKGGGEKGKEEGGEKEGKEESQEESKPKSKVSTTFYFKIMNELAATIRNFQTGTVSKDVKIETNEAFITWIRNYGLSESSSRSKETFTQVIEYLKPVMDSQFLPHIECPEFVYCGDNDIWQPYQKFTAYVELIIKYTKCFTRNKAPDDRDSFSTIQLATSAVETGLLVRKGFQFLMGIIVADLKKNPGGDKTPIISQLTSGSRGDAVITSEIETSYSTGQWGMKIGKKRPGVVQPHERKSLIAQFHGLRKTAIPGNRNSNLEKPRRVHHTSYGVVDPANTPDSDQIGLVRALALSVMITSENDQAYKNVMDFIQDVLYETVFDTRRHSEGESSQENQRFPLYVNDTIVGYCTMEFYKDLRRAKRGLLFGYFTEVYMKEDADKWDDGREVHVKTTSGRAMRPLLVVENGEIAVLRHLNGPERDDYLKNIGRLLEEGLLEYVSVTEFLYSDTASTYEQFVAERATRRFDYIELDPMMVMSVETGVQPYSHHHPNPRTMFGGAMMRQSMSVPFATFTQHQETELKILHYPHAPLVTTDVARVIGHTEQSGGQMIHVAIMSKKGTDEDATIWNKAFIDAGGLNGTIYNTYTALASATRPDETDNPALYENGVIKIRYPTEAEGELPQKVEEFETEEEVKKFTEFPEAEEEKEWPFPEGFPKLKGATNVLVRPNDLLARFVKKNIASAEVEKLTVTGKRSGFMTHIHTAGEGVDKKIKITTRFPHIPKEGDKAANELGQKGVSGKVLPPEDMPVSLEHGFSPSVIFGPAGMPSRMTMGMITDIFAGAAYSNPDRNRIVENLVRWPVTQKEPNLNDSNDFWIVLSDAMVYKSDFRLFSFIHSEVEEEVREMERSPDFSYPNDVQNFDEYVNILKQEKIEDLEGDGWEHRRGLVIGLNVAERRFIVPGTEYVSKIFTGDVAEHVIRFSQLPTNLQRDWYDQNFSTIVPNYLMYQEREYDDERWLDASTFREPDLETFYRVLRRKGFSPMGESKFLTKNGEITEMTVFSGPLYWMQLEHLTDGKYQIRDQGSMATISRGAAKGKAVGGAVRAGELSHSAMIAHGDGNYLQERFMTAADKFKTLICSSCGKQCHIMGITAATVCSTCGSRALPYQVTMPYAGVRLMSLLSVVGAGPTLKVKPKAGHTIASGFEVEEEEMEAGRFV